MATYGSAGSQSRFPSCPIPIEGSYTISSILSANAATDLETTLVVLGHKVYDITCWLMDGGGGAGAEERRELIKEAARQDPYEGGRRWAALCGTDDERDECTVGLLIDDMVPRALAMQQGQGGGAEPYRRDGSPGITDASSSSLQLDQDQDHDHDGAADASWWQGDRGVPRGLRSLNPPGSRSGFSLGPGPGPADRNGARGGTPHLVIAMRLLEQYRARLAAVQARARGVQAEVELIKREVEEVEYVRDFLVWQACEGIRPRWAGWE